VDGVVKKTWKLKALGAKSNFAVKSYSIGKLSAGFHTLTIVVDPEGVISEEDKGDNEYNKTIQVLEGS
jgi:subtilase family serine protease